LLVGLVRQPAVAGSFYPADSNRLEEVVEAHLRAQSCDAGDVPKAIIAPHAGYPYSGPIAGSVYSLFRHRAGEIRTVVLVGPAHRVAIRGLAAPGCDEFETPLGRVPVDRRAVEALKQQNLISIDDRVHRDEHGLEVHLPFLQTILDEFSIVPLVVGDADAGKVKAVLDAQWGGPETLMVVSSDLSHYYPYDQARTLDGKTAEAIEKLAPEDIAAEQACGRTAIQGLLLCARERNLVARTLDLRNSGDTAGTRDQVVGYGAFIVN
jgi:hypothetical protein